MALITYSSRPRQRAVFPVFKYMPCNVCQQWETALPDINSTQQKDEVELMAIVPLGFMRSETNEHMKEGKRKGYGPNMAGPVTYAWFYERVKYGGVWDYKTQSRSLENFGNFHYGAVGTAAGIPDSILLRAAGCAQSAHQSLTTYAGSCLGNAPYGDDPKDQFWIKQGIDYAKQHGF